MRSWRRDSIRSAGGRYNILGLRVCPAKRNISFAKVLVRLPVDRPLANHNCLPEPLEKPRPVRRLLHELLGLGTLVTAPA